jgi:hypothetical protein
MRSSPIEALVPGGGTARVDLATEGDASAQGRDFDHVQTSRAGKLQKGGR